MEFTVGIGCILFIVSWVAAIMLWKGLSWNVVTYSLDTHTVSGECFVSE
jgi:hypothetical protein